ncbi:PTS sugar transporter subunit IIA [Metabacillus idriensis]|uniref:Mannitol-specific phosphotransferase enzyme IIA component n=1 Tax=Metabacillus idriensis TaxID=324768 RepID=A0A6I2MHG4_9BACI|nr:PTS sugar transporter subunit IIA [Metabacillus idriensis]MCM3598814.1 PTS sugar transporter subunit IIA [Metabacillus idriensis]MRX56516.1 PTS mannitol transporter subunit IIA [Metabacillus idriensis]OHR73507.1 PTS mannitol transporter subunit IIA [Bacillus sp. HMSC76G11]
MKKILDEANILLNQTIGSKEEAIRLTGKLLVENGYVNEDYIEKMLHREELSTTYMGNGVAIPHGTEDAKKEVNYSGISIVQVPEGVDFGTGEDAKILFGIAGKDGEHLELLSQIAILCSEEENVHKMLEVTSKQELIALFEEGN